MRKITGIKRALAILLTLSLLFSAMAVAGVAAATGTEYHYTFDSSDGLDYYADYYIKHSATEHYNNTISVADGVETKLVTGGYNGSAYQMKMAYTANGTTSDAQHFASFSLPNNTGAAVDGRNHGATMHLLAGVAYSVRITYKVTGYVSPMALYYTIGMGALSDTDIAAFNASHPTKIGDIVGASDGWQTAEAVVTPAVKNGGYIVLKMANETNRAGTEVLIGAIDIVPTGATPTPTPSTPAAEYKYTFDADDGYDYAADYYIKHTATEHYNNTISEAHGVETKLVAGGYNGSDYAMKMAYTANGVTEDKMHFASFSLPNNTGAAKDGRNHGSTMHLLEGVPYSVKITYKVTGYTTPAALYYAIGMGALSDTDLAAFSASYPTKLASITGTTSGWNTVEVEVTPGTKNGGYIVLKMEDDANRAGTEVQIGEIVISKVDLSNTPSIVFDSNGGSAVDTIIGVAGQPINYPAAPTRAGFDFVGWFLADGSAAPTVFGNGKITVIAKWEENGQSQVEVTGTEYHYTFDADDGYDYFKDYYIFNSGLGSYTNNEMADTEGINTSLVAGGYNGSDYAMKMAYTVNGATADQQRYASFSVPNNTGANVNGRDHGKTIHLEVGSTFKMVVTYKVTGYVSPMALYYTIGMGALGDSDVPAFTACNPSKIMDITAASSEWQTAEAIVSPAVKDGAYFLLKMQQDENRAGTEVLIGAIDIIPIAATSVMFDSNGGSMVNAVYGEVGTPITYPANPTKEGYKFLGWYKESGAAAPDNFPPANIKLIAKWQDLSVWGFEAEANNTELALNAASGFSAKVTTAVKYNENQALAVSSNNKTGALRPQFFVKNAEGAQVTVEKGKNYTVSFYAYIPSASALREFHYWLTATERTDAYATGGEKDAEKILEVISIKVADNGGADKWFEVTATIRDCPYSGNVMMGITGDSTAAHTFYIDDLKIAEKRIIVPEEGAWSFETEPNDQLLSLNPRIPETTIRTDDSVAYAGSAAARVNSDNSSGDLRPQMMVKDGDGNQVMIEKGKNYVITYYVMVPAGQTDYKINYWLTASTDDVCYNNTSYKKTPYVIYEGIESVAAKNGEWKKITAVVEDSPLAGMLRLGICADGKSGSQVVFYIDDIKVEEVDSVESIAQSFEDYAVGEELDLNEDSLLSIVVSDAVGGNTGSQAAAINSNTGAGNPRPQMTLKGGIGQPIQVYKGRSYEVTFYLYVPVGQPLYKINYWLAATQDEVCFSNNGPLKDDYVVAEVSEMEQPAQGLWTEVSIRIDNCRHTGTLRLGITGNTTTAHTFYIDDITVEQKMLEPETYVDSFERYENNEDLSLNSSITVSNKDSHAGAFSAQIVTSGNDVNSAPQMVINDYRTDPVKVEKGKKYRVSFWVAVPKNAPDYDIQFWLAVTDSNAAFTTERQNLVVDTVPVAINAKYVWQYVSVDIADCPYAGTLRLGITGSTAEAHTFYLDDIRVEERINAAADPDAMNFENYLVGENLALNQQIPDIAGNTIIVSNDESYTGAQSVLFHADTNGGDNRPQMMVKDAEGNQIKLEEGEDYYISFMVLVPTTEEYFSFSYWLAVTPDSVGDACFKRESPILKNDYVIAEQSAVEPPTPGEWTEIKVAVMDCPRSGSLRIGLTHGNGAPFESNFYVDDIKVAPPDYVLVKFDTNGSEDVYEDILMMSGLLITFNEVDPYREGYEFMGWYTSKTFAKDTYFDIYNTPVVGKTGDVLTLYACWREWGDVSSSGNREETPKYKVEYYTDKIWVGDQNVPESPYDDSQRPVFGEAEPIVVTPDPIVEEDSSLPPWLIVVIVVCAVVIVGGGAVIAALLLKRNKKES